MFTSSPACLSQRVPSIVTAFGKNVDPFMLHSMRRSLSKSAA
jgi:hypothetical protein